MGPTANTNGIDTLSTQVLNSLTPLSDADIKAIQPARISVVSATTQAEANSLISRMKYEGATDKRLFEILNGLSPGELPKPGVRVKIVQ
jgi:predicted Zn-dependent protease